MVFWCESASAAWPEAMGQAHQPCGHETATVGRLTAWFTVYISRIALASDRAIATTIARQRHRLAGRRH